MLGTAVVAVWLVVLGLHARREYGRPATARLAEAALTLDPGVTFYTLRMGERAVGQATSSLDTVDGGFQLEDRMILELPALGRTGNAVVRTRVELDSALRMDRFQFSLDSDVGRFQADGDVRGDTLLEVHLGSAPHAETLSFRMASPPVFSAVVPIRVALGEGLEVGKRLRLPVFDPSTLSTRTVEVRILEHDTLAIPDSVVMGDDGRWSTAGWDSVPAWRIAEVFGGVSMESWIDGDGRILRATSPLGFSMERTEFELARQALEDGRTQGAAAVDDDVILATAIQSDVPLDDVESRAELRFVLKGVELAGFDLDGGRQRLHGDTLVVRREAWDALEAGYTLPYKRMDLREALEPEPLIQSDDPRIIEAARTMTRRRYRGTDDPRRAAEMLTEGVYDRLKKEITFSVPSALQVLESGQGDCNEHTVLYVALARALGLPARTAVGLVYVNGAFYYHAWPEVWLGRWVAVDPTFGQTPADAAHIRFLVGGLAEQVELLRLIGRLDIDVVDPEARR